MNLPPEAHAILGLIISGAFYDNIKIATTLSYGLAKESLSKYLPFKENELDIIEAEIISCDDKISNSKEDLEKYINENKTIQKIIQDIGKREPLKVKKIVNSFKKNDTTSFDLELGDNVKITDSFNENENCEINIR